MILSALISDFLEYLEFKRNVSPLTVRNYSHYLKHFIEFSGNINPKDIDLSLVRKYALYLSERVDPKTQGRLKKVTQNFFLIALRTFLRYLAGRGIQTLSASDVELKKGEVRDLEILDNAQAKLLLEAPDMSKIDGVRDRAVLEMLFSTGLRVSELVSLNRDINLDQKELVIIGKGAKLRTVFLSDEACGWLKRYLALRKDTFNPLFIRFQGKADLTVNGESMRLSVRSIERIVEKYGKKAQLTIKATPHSFRHHCAAHLLTSGTEVRTVQERLGHVSASSLQVYTGKDQ